MRAITRTSCILTLLVLPCSASVSRAVNYINDWDWIWNRANQTLAPNVNPRVLNPATWGSWDPYINYIVITAKSADIEPAAGRPTDKAAYIIDWDWAVDQQGNAVTNQNPLVLDPASWSGFDPVWTEMVIADSGAFQWTRVTFTQTAGPLANAFDAVIDWGDLSNCGTSILNAECVPVDILPPGNYMIDVRVEPGFAVTQAQVQIIDNTPWSTITFTQTTGPVPNVFGPVTVYNGGVSDCASILDAQCRYIGSVQPGVYAIQATVNFAGKKAPVTQTIPLEVGSGSIVVSGGATPAVGSTGLIVLGLSILAGGGVLVRRSGRGA